MALQQGCFTEQCLQEVCHFCDADAEHSTSNNWEEESINALLPAEAGGRPATVRRSLILSSSPPRPLAVVAPVAEEPLKASPSPAIAERYKQAEALLDIPLDEPGTFQPRRLRDAQKQEQAEQAVQRQKPPARIGDSVDAKYVYSTSSRRVRVKRVSVAAPIEEKEQAPQSLERPQGAEEGAVAPRDDALVGQPQLPFDDEPVRATQTLHLPAQGGANSYAHVAYDEDAARIHPLRLQGAPEKEVEAPGEQQHAAFSSEVAVCCAERLTPTAESETRIRLQPGEAESSGGLRQMFLCCAGQGDPQRADIVEPLRGTEESLPNGKWQVVRKQGKVVLLRPDGSQHVGALTDEPPQAQDSAKASAGAAHEGS